MSIISIAKRVDQAEKRLAVTPRNRVVVALPGQTDGEAIAAARVGSTDKAHIIRVAFVAATTRPRGGSHVDA